MGVAGISVERKVDARADFKIARANLKIARANFKIVRAQFGHCKNARAN